MQAVKLKKSVTTHWQSPNTGATNESGITALPGGFRNGFGYSAGLTVTQFGGAGVFTIQWMHHTGS